MRDPGAFVWMGVVTDVAAAIAFSLAIEGVGDPYTAVGGLAGAALTWALVMYDPWRERAKQKASARASERAPRGASQQADS